MQHAWQWWIATRLCGRCENGVADLDLVLSHAQPRSARPVREAESKILVWKVAPVAQVRVHSGGEEGSGLSKFTIQSLGLLRVLDREAKYQFANLALNFSNRLYAKVWLQVVNGGNGTLQSVRYQQFQDKLRFEIKQDEVELAMRDLLRDIQYELGKLCVAINTVLGDANLFNIVASFLDWGALARMGECSKACFGALHSAQLVWLKEQVLIMAFDSRLLGTMEFYQQSQDAFAQVLRVRRWAANLIDKLSDRFVPDSSQTKAWDVNHTNNRQPRYVVRKTFFGGEE
ncbi:hypothetical protein BASA81_005526 [Batrachochytrium salamandrivorans]|nr:hypothetical protein BASA81_005526 [Batrachochytrium salamandrivorans]